MCICVLYIFFNCYLHCFKEQVISGYLWLMVTNSTSLMSVVDFCNLFDACSDYVRYVDNNKWNNTRTNRYAKD